VRQNVRTQSRSTTPTDTPELETPIPAVDPATFVGSTTASTTDTILYDDVPESQPVLKEGEEASTTDMADTANTPTP